MLNRFLLFLFLIISHCSIYANVYRYRLFFDGKPDSKPVALSDRAVSRRDRLSIMTDDLDLNVSSLYLQELRKAGFTIVTCSRWLNSAVVMKSDGSAITDVEMSSFPFVKKSELITMPESSSQATTRAPERNQESYSTFAPTEDCTTPLREVNAYESLYRAGYRGEGVLIAVFDGGYLRLNECDFLNDKVDFVHDLYNPSETETAFTGSNHGIQCMSIMACPEEEGVCGTAQDARYYLFCTENNTYESAIEEDMWVAAAEMADSLGVDIISSSLGYGEYNHNLLSHTPDELAQNSVFVSIGAKIASQKGILVVNSSGNYGNRSWRRILFPSDTEEVLTVGAYTPDLVAAEFTGLGFLSPYVKPDVSARGKFCYTIQPVNNGFEVRNIAAGTSFSTPLIAGLCASLWSAVPELTPTELRQVIDRSASDYDNPTIFTGYGLPDFAAALKMARELKGYTSLDNIINEATDGRSAASRCYNLMGLPVTKPSQKGAYIVNGRIVFQNN